MGSVYANHDVMRSDPQRPLYDHEQATVEKIKAAGQEFWDLLDGISSVPSREISTAKTKIEEAVMWAVKHATR